MVTIILMQNTDEVLFKILWKEIHVSKLVIMLSLTFAGFIIGLIMGRPKKKPLPTSETTKNVPLEINNTEDTYIEPPKKNLSDEDRDYIS